MIIRILKSAFENFQSFFVSWLVIIVANQLFIFGACFAPYCLVASLPHTFLIAIVVNFFILMDGSGVSKSPDDLIKGEKFPVEKQHGHIKYTQPEVEVQSNDFEDTEIPYCPKCGASMKLRIARNGKYAGRNFWGCSKYPDCKGLLNID